MIRTRNYRLGRRADGVRRALKTVTLSLSALLAAVPASAADRYSGDPVRGLAKAAACVSCHEGHGRSTGTSLFPRIGGQNFEYLYYALREYRDGQRSVGWARAMMVDAVKDFSDDDLKDIARYFGSLPW